jgi:chemotaxis protein MotB
MQAFKTTILVTSVLALAGCASWDKSPICNPSHQWVAWSDVRCNPPEAPRNLAAELAEAQQQNDALSRRVSGLERQIADRDREIAALRSSAGDSSKLANQLSSAQSDLDQSQQRTRNLEQELAASQALVASLQVGAADKDKLATDLAEARQRIVELESRLADRDRELAGLRGELSAEMAKLKEAQRGLIKALRPQIEKGDITIDLNNERLLINLASSYLFASGQDDLKSAGADALKQVGMVLKDFPEYKVAVDGHTDNVPIQGALKKKFPTNKELSESRAANAAKALTEGGLGAVITHGYADTKPAEPNASASGRAKNRRVEVRVTK